MVRLKSLSVFCLLAILFISPNITLAVEVSMFGPLTVVKPPGSPQEQLFNFNMPVARGGFVRVDTVSSARISMNGVEIGSPSDFNGLVIDVPATMVAGNNVLGVEVRGKKNSTVEVEVFAFDEAPTASFSASPLSGIIPLSVNFDATASSDPDSDITGYSWDFGDGNNAAGATTSNFYTTVNLFTATLTVIDAFGLTSQATDQIDAMDIPPGTTFLTGRILDTNDFVATGTETPVVGVTVTLLIPHSQQPATSTVTSYWWEFPRAIRFSISTAQGRIWPRMV